ncbi:hypothetical protein [Burkholderia ambifaria]|nr:hypothetical protein [Burkholderia ambifaria]
MRFSHFVPSCAVLLYGIFATMPHDVAYAQVSPDSTSVPRAIARLIASKAGQLGYTGTALDEIVAATEQAMAAAAQAEAAASAGAS